MTWIREKEVTMYYYYEKPDYEANPLSRSFIKVLSRGVQSRGNPLPPSPHDITDTLFLSSQWQNRKAKLIHYALRPSRTVYHADS